MEIYLIRHTTPDVDPGICYGQTDIELQDSFNKELDVLRKKLPMVFDVTYTSPLKRCYRLAQSINTKELKVESRLMELDFGDWEMRSWDELYKNGVAGWMDDFVTVRPPNGESFADLAKRVGPFFDEIISRPHETVALVTHAGVIRTMIAYAIGLPLEHAFNMILDYSKVSCIRIVEDTKRLVFLNV